MKRPASPWLHELKWPDIAEYLETNDIVLVPIGATEQHGRHLPLLVDTAWACKVSEGVARSEHVLIAPPLHFGWSPHHLGYPGGITLRGDTLMQVAIDVAESLLSHGFKKVVFVNGNRVANLPPLQIAMAKLRFATDAYVAILDTHLIARKEVCELCDNAPNASHHAGDAETSFMLHAHPELVAASEIGPTRDRQRPAFLNNIAMDPPFDANVAFCHPTASEFMKATEPYGYYSNPTAASAAKGQRILEVTIARSIEFIRQVKKIEVSPRRPAIPV